MLNSARQDATPHIAIVPGLGDSGPSHWQTLWEKEIPSCLRVNQKEWESPVLSDWLEAMSAVVRNNPFRLVFVAHSLGCLLVAHFASNPLAKKIEGAFLVAPPDVEDTKLSPELSGLLSSFSPIPTHRLPFRAVVVASENDPYAKISRSESFAKRWGATFVNVGDCGHINAASGHGPWPEGRHLFNKAFLTPSLI